MCEHIKVECIECDNAGGYCHCIDGGTKFCNECGKMEWEWNK